METVGLLIVLPGGDGGVTWGVSLRQTPTAGTDLGENMEMCGCREAGHHHPRKEQGIPVESSSLRVSFCINLQYMLI